MDRIQLQEIGKSAVRANADTFPDDADTVLWMWSQVNAAIDAVVQAAIGNHDELAEEAASEQAAQREADTVNLAWARQVLADAGINPSERRIGAIKAIREAARKPGVCDLGIGLRGCKIVVDRLLKDATSHA